MQTGFTVNTYNATTSQFLPHEQKGIQQVKSANTEVKKIYILCCGGQKAF